jgi:hypothetical protein
MTPRRIAPLFVVAVLGGCYRPSIQPGGLLCADGGACPEGFHCGANDRRCHPGATSMCLPDAAVAQLCTDQPLGSPCDPICQQGCACGRCNLNGETLACVPSGSKLRGDLCNLDNDDCVAGLVCLRELCSPQSPDAGQQFGRCYRYCAGDQHCDGRSCNVEIETAAATTLWACELPPRTCNPVGGSDSCGHGLLGCYVDSNGSTFCECAGDAGDAEPCNVFTSCVPGFRCVQQGGGTTPRCRRVCRLGESDCASTSTCTATPGDSMFGYCAP